MEFVYRHCIEAIQHKLRPHFPVSAQRYKFKQDYDQHSEGIREECDCVKHNSFQL